MPHRKEFENLLNKAQDEAHQDNKAFDEAQAKIANIKGADIARKEYGEIGDKEARGGLSLEETAALLKENGYLDTSFEGKEVHELVMRALSKEEAIDEYKKSGGETFVWNEMEMNMPYTIPNAENLYVMIMSFNKEIRSDEALAEMDKLGVRPLTYEELIQYGIAHPSHQEQKYFVGLGSKHPLEGSMRAPTLNDDVGFGRRLKASPCDGVWRDNYRFLVVRK